jgi:hypothetical protein
VITTVSRDQKASYAQILEWTQGARQLYVRQLGEPDPRVWAPGDSAAVAPGTPVWPHRPGWQYVRNGNETLIMSNGLCDPFRTVSGINVGYGVEIAVTTTDGLSVVGPGCWLFELALAVSNQAAKDGQFLQRHEKFGTFLFSTRGAPEAFAAWVDGAGEIGFLVGMPLPGRPAVIELPCGQATLLIAKLLTPREYGYVVQTGPAGAMQLVEYFEQDGTRYLSSMTRASAL